MIHLSEPYQPRKITFRGVEELCGWRLKVYGIAYRNESPGEPLVEAARSVVQQLLSAGSVGGYRLGFLGVHEGRGANFVFLDWWADENELHHRVFVSPTDEPRRLEEKTGSGLAACVWDLKVICFERQAWITHILGNPRGPDVEGYLASGFSGRV